MRKYLWILLCFALLACWISGCGGGGGSNPLEPSPDDYILLALYQDHVIRWTQPIGVFMDQVHVPADWKPEHAAFFQQAMTTWTDAAQGKFSFVTLTSSSQPCVVVRWVKDHPYGEAPPTIGITKLDLATINNVQYIQNVRMELAVDDANGQPMPDSIMKLLSVHELGHAIGIWGHSDDPNDVMYQALGSQPGLSFRDINTINRLYSLDPDIYELPHAVRSITPEKVTTITMP